MWNVSQNALYYWKLLASNKQHSPNVWAHWLPSRSDQYKSSGVIPPDNFVNLIQEIIIIWRPLKPPLIYPRRKHYLLSLSREPKYQIWYKFQFCMACLLKSYKVFSTNDVLSVYKFKETKYCLPNIYFFVFTLFVLFSPELTILICC